MKIKFRIMCFILIILFNSTILNGQEGTSLLGWGDYKWLQEKNSDGPQMRSALGEAKQWESFEEWHCFDVGKVELVCSVYGENMQVPSITVSRNSHLYFFDLPVEDDYDCKRIINDWSELAIGSSRICIMAAELPGTFEDNLSSLWYLNVIKTEHGYWALSDI